MEYFLPLCVFVIMKELQVALSREKDRDRNNKGGKRNLSLLFRPKGMYEEDTVVNCENTLQSRVESIVEHSLSFECQKPFNIYLHSPFYVC